MEWCAECDGRGESYPECCKADCMCDVCDHMRTVPHPGCSCEDCNYARRRKHYERLTVGEILGALGKGAMIGAFGSVVLFGLVSIISRF